MRAYIPAVKLIALPAEMNSFLWSLAVRCEKWYNFSSSLFKEEAFSTAGCLFGLLCILTISHYAIMHARHDKHPFEKLPVTLAKLISVIITVSSACCYLKNQFRVCTLLCWQRPASIAKKYCGGGAKYKSQIPPGLGLHQTNRQRGNDTHPSNQQASFCRTKWQPEGNACSLDTLTCLHYLQNRRLLEQVEAKPRGDHKMAPEAEDWLPHHQTQRRKKMLHRFRRRPES